jgi:hypothetical protein
VNGASDETERPPRKPVGWHVCRERGWYCVWDERAGVFYACGPEWPGAIPDLNRYWRFRETGDESPMYAHVPVPREGNPELRPRLVLGLDRLKGGGNG